VSRVILIHWDRSGAGGRAASLRRGGHRVRPLSPPGGAGLREVAEDPPEAFVIDLDRLPSHGRAVATWIRNRKGTRRVPIVFAGGGPGVAARARDLLPDAVFSPWEEIGEAVRKAVEDGVPAEPLVPSLLGPVRDMPLARKLGIRAGSVVRLLGAPPGFEEALGALPEGARLRRGGRGRAHRVLLFMRSARDLERRLGAAARGLGEGEGLWIVWPKKGSHAAGDLTQGAVRAAGLRAGLVDYKICSVDGTWSGLLFTRRKGRAAGRREGGPPGMLESGRAPGRGRHRRPRGRDPGKRG
jgi:hypothetical protein